jgi:ketosteroid isomerase-like protein
VNSHRWTQDSSSLLRHVYDRFNARDMETVLASMHEDVMWANGMEGGHVRGREAVRSYWTRQWAMIDPHVEPVAFSSGPGGETIVRVHQVVHDLNGSLLADREVKHIFQIEDRLISVLISASYRAKAAEKSTIVPR